MGDALQSSVNFVRDVAAVTATYNRPELLFRLLDSLAAGNPEVGVVCVADNAADPTLQSRLQAAPLAVEYVPSPGNPGCGAGLRLAEEQALKSAQWKYLLVLDDDAVLDAGCVAQMKNVLASSDALAATPLILDHAGCLTSFPGLMEAAPWAAIRQPSAESYLAHCGTRPVPFDWCPGVCLLVKREAFEKEGLHRADFWLLGEDLEFSMRMARRHSNIFVPAARAHHLPPPGRGAPTDWIMIKEAAMLINSAYLGFHVAHSRRLLRFLPGNIFRYLKLFHFRPKAVLLALRCIYWGAIRARTASNACFQRVVSQHKR